MLAILFYDVIVALHVMAIVMAFGVTFAYPVLTPWFGRVHPGSLPALHGAQARVSRLLITPMATLALFTGLYLAADRELFKELWVAVPMTILIVLLGLTGAFFAPTERRLAELATRDLSRSGSPGPEGGGLSEEYAALLRRWNLVGAVAGGLVLVAIFFMVAKPGA